MDRFIVEQPDRIRMSTVVEIAEESSGVRLRPLTNCAAHQQFLVELHQAPVWEFLGEQVELDAQDLAATDLEGIPGDHLVVERGSDGLPVGWVNFLPSSSGVRRLQVTVLPQHQKSGFGKVAVVAAIAWFWANSEDDWIRIEIDERNASSVALRQRLDPKGDLLEHVGRDENGVSVYCLTRPHALQS